MPANISARTAGEAGVVLGRAAAAAWRAGELPVAPEDIRAVIRGEPGTSGLEWLLAAGFSWAPRRCWGRCRSWRGNYLP